MSSPQVMLHYASPVTERPDLDAPLILALLVTFLILSIGFFAIIVYTTARY